MSGLLESLRYLLRPTPTPPPPELRLDPDHGLTYRQLRKGTLVTGNAKDTECVAHRLLTEAQRLDIPAFILSKDAYLADLPEDDSRRRLTVAGNTEDFDLTLRQICLWGAQHNDNPSPEAPPTLLILAPDTLKCSENNQGCKPRILQHWDMLRGHQIAPVQCLLNEDITSMWEGVAEQIIACRPDKTLRRITPILLPAHQDVSLIARNHTSLPIQLPLTP